MTSLVNFIIDKTFASSIADNDEEGEIGSYDMER